MKRAGAESEPCPEERTARPAERHHRVRYRCVVRGTGPVAPAELIVQLEAELSPAGERERPGMEEARLQSEAMRRTGEVLRAPERTPAVELRADLMEEGFRRPDYPDVEDDDAGARCVLEEQPNCEFAAGDEADQLAVSRLSHVGGAPRFDPATELDQVLSRLR